MGGGEPSLALPLLAVTRLLGACRELVKKCPEAANASDAHEQYRAAAHSAHMNKTYVDIHEALKGSPLQGTQMRGRPRGFRDPGAPIEALAAAVARLAPIVAEFPRHFAIADAADRVHSAAIRQRKRPNAHKRAQLAVSHPGEQPAPATNAGKKLRRK